MKVFPVSALIALVLIAFSLPTLLAQSPAAAQANEAAYALFSSGDYTGSAAAYEKLIKDYPTDGVVSVATVQLAFSQFFLGQYDPALATLAKAVSGPPLPPDAAQVVDNFLPQILSAKASAMELNDPKRKAAFEDAIKKYSDFITKYPQSPELESAMFGRAIANFQIQNYDKAVEDLQSNVQKFGKSGTIASSKNLLALALATLGGQELGKEGGDQAKGMGLLKQGEDLLRQVITEKKDIGLINDSYFQIGEILFTRASFGPEAERPPLFQQALEAYRSIIPKDEVVALQQDKIKGFPALKAAALRANNAALKKQLDKDNERELQKLGEIRAKPDQVATAVLKMGEIFFNAQKYNEARVLIGHVSPFLTTDDAKIRAQYFTTMTYALQNAADRAVENYQSFTAANKGNPIAENLPFAVGNMYLALGNPTEAIKFFDDSIAQYPEGRLAGLSVVSKAQAEASLQQFENALKTFQTYLAKNPSPEVAVVAQYGLAGIYKDTAKWDDAIDAYKIVKDKFPGTPQAVEADYWIAIATQQKGDNAAAIPLTKSSKTNFPARRKPWRPITGSPSPPSKRATTPPPSRSSRPSSPPMKNIPSPLSPRTRSVVPKSPPDKNPKASPPSPSSPKNSPPASPLHIPTSCGPSFLPPTKKSMRSTPSCGSSSKSILRMTRSSSLTTRLHKTPSTSPNPTRRSPTTRNSSKNTPRAPKPATPW